MADAARATATHPIERAATTDVPALAALVREVAVPGWSETVLHASLCDAASIALVERSADGAVCGFTIARCAADEVEVLLVAVVPASRRRGVATALVDAVLDAAARAGAAVAHLEVRASNAAAIALYERLGFVAAGRRPRYYDATEDAVTMRRALGRNPH